jgi:hypothetical protein
MFRFSGSLDLKADSGFRDDARSNFSPARSGLFYPSGALNPNDTQDLPFLPPASAALVLSSQDKYEQAEAMHRQNTQSTLSSQIQRLLTTSRVYLGFVSPMSLVGQQVGERDIGERSWKSTQNVTPTTSVLLLVDTVNDLYCSLRPARLTTETRSPRNIHFIGVYLMGCISRACLSWVYILWACISRACAS